MLTTMQVNLKLVIFLIFLTRISAKDILDLTGNVTLSPNFTTDGIDIKIKRGDKECASGTIGSKIDFTKYQSDCKNLTCFILNGKVRFEVKPIENGFNIIFESKDLSIQFMDKWNLNSQSTHWYGGPEKRKAEWPIEKLTLDGKGPYLVLSGDSSVMTPYWLNSKGFFLFVEKKVPLYLDQNKMEKDKLILTAKIEGPFINRKRIHLNYTIAALEDPQKAHLFAVDNFLMKPKGHPNEKMIREPIWTTWAYFKKSISDNILIKFAKDIKDHNFTKGQIEIDDDWETCYGSLTFKTDKFAKISETVKTIKSMGFRVTLWTHPFVDEGCDPWSKDGKTKNYFVKNTTGSDKAEWWDSQNSHRIDFTNPDAKNWYISRLKSLQQNPGIDSFKFDAGEIDHSPQPSVYNKTDPELWPRVACEEYIRTVAQIGDLIEVRTASYTQDLPIFMRMLDKDSHWGIDNGLYTLVTSLLQLNMAGYTMVLPDMIGGNGYDKKPSAELLVRWTEANTFMPSMQFSYPPWDITSDKFDTVKITQKFLELHADYSDEILQAMKESIKNGTPVNPPIWWLDPTDLEALKMDTEYLLGTSILVAPVLIEGATTRNVYLPKGNWKDGNNGTLYKGPLWLNNYPAPIDVLPYFIYITKS